MTELGCGRFLFVVESGERRLKRFRHALGSGSQGNRCRALSCAKDLVMVSANGVHGASSEIRDAVHLRFHRQKFIIDLRVTTGT